MNNKPEPGTLYLVGTPIGNLEDITYRAVRILSEADIVASEDTRRTARLLNHFQIKKPLVSYYEQNKDSRTPELIDKLLSGLSVALVSDAGLPGIADPGVQLVEACVTAGIAVTPVPGANAALSALICSGMDTRRFVFLGFLPRTDKKRLELLEKYADDSSTLIIYEAPHRLVESLQSAGKVLGNRPAVIAREITKKFEEFIYADIDKLIDKYSEEEPRGEFVLVISGATTQTVSSSRCNADECCNVLEALNELLQSGLSRNEALRSMTKTLGVSKRELYKKIEQLKAEEPL